MGATAAGRVKNVCEVDGGTGFHLSSVHPLP
jgi:hypothetical protein